jgi:hypothetical protein
MRLMRFDHETDSDCDNNRIRCVFGCFSIDSAPPYIAVSYTWGSCTDTQEIIIEGQPYPVRKNLWEFLDRIWYGTSDWFWIDALCIDQTNLSERNHQVNLMSRIYQTVR